MRSLKVLPEPETLAGLIKRNLRNSRPISTAHRPTPCGGKPNCPAFRRALSRLVCREFIRTFDSENSCGLQVPEYRNDATRFWGHRSIKYNNYLKDTANVIRRGPSLRQEQLRRWRLQNANQNRQSAQHGLPANQTSTQIKAASSHCPVRR